MEASFSWEVESRFKNWLVYAEIRKILTTNTSTIDCFLWPEKQVHGVVYIKNRDKKSN